MEDEYMSDDDYDMFEHYLEIGAIEVEGVDENGELLFSMSERTKEIAPELWEAHTQAVDHALIKLYEDGLIEVEYDENLEATLNLSEEASKILSRLGFIELEDE